ncbi:MAG: carbamoyl transferase [Bdellovibrionales bacterium]|nr:carbamoyl transferase [Bdellovibrionales bacterium]
MYILGLSSYSHESSAALLKDGQLIALGEEERFNREKHTSKFPEGAIRYCLQQAGITIDQVDAFTFFWKPVRELTGNLSHVAKFFPKSLGLLAAPSGGEDYSFTQRVMAMQNVGRDLQARFGLATQPKVHFVEHHLCHAASAFYPSPFEEAAILTIDGRGESTSTMMSVGRGTRIEKLREIKVPHSIGHLYASLTNYLGFRPFHDEWKVMGMSAYGKPTFVKDFEDVVQLTSEGGYRLNLDYFSFHVKGQSQWLSEKFLGKFGPRREPKGEYTQHYYDIAYALQKLVERVGVHLANDLHEKTGLPDLCMTGGVALNCLMNREVVRQTRFKNFFFQPIANDAGTSFGSALYHYHQSCGRPRNFRFNSVYWGPEYSNDEIEPVLKEKGVTYRRSSNIAADTATEIAAGKIVGWFQGRMECGPRALGNRSITVDPTRAEMKDRLNARVKRREGFRPFAPSVIKERWREFFEIPKDQESPYMILIGDVKKGMESKIPAVTHADGTARVHTVDRDINPRYWDLINEFGKITGVPVLINTSFNENEPIVCTPEHAVNCFLRTEFDVLAIGDFLVTK